MFPPCPSRDVSVASILEGDEPPSPCGGSTSKPPRAKVWTHAIRNKGGGHTLGVGLTGIFQRQRVDLSRRVVSRSRAVDRDTSRSRRPDGVRGEVTDLLTIRDLSRAGPLRRSSVVDAYAVGDSLVMVHVRGHRRARATGEVLDTDLVMSLRIDDGVITHAFDLIDARAEDYLRRLQGS